MTMTARRLRGCANILKQRKRNSTTRISPTPAFKVLVQDRTFLVASVCRDIWQQLESGSFAIRGQELLLVKEFVLAPNLTMIYLRNTGVTDAGAIEIANKCPILTYIDLCATRVAEACKTQMKQVRKGRYIG